MADKWHTLLLTIVSCAYLFKTILSSMTGTLSHNLIFFLRHTSNEVILNIVKEYPSDIYKTGKCSHSSPSHSRKREKACIQKFKNIFPKFLKHFSLLLCKEELVFIYSIKKEKKNGWTESVCLPNNSFFCYYTIKKLIFSYILVKEKHTNKS